MLDLTELASGPRRVMRLMLRHHEMSHADLCQALAALPEDQRVTGAELDEALAMLTGQAWLVLTGTDDARRYKVNFRRSPARVLTEVRPRRRAGGGLGKSIWDALGAGPSSEPAAGGSNDSPDAGATPAPAPPPKE